MKHISLLEKWLLLQKDISVTSQMAGVIMDAADGWLPVDSIPCDVHTVLEQNGIIGDTLVGLNSKECEWMEKCSWWFKKSFTLTDDDLDCTSAELFLDGLDIHADIFLNRAFLGHHASAMYPFIKNVLPWLHKGENTLLIRLTCGLERVIDEELMPVKEFVAGEYKKRCPGRGDDRRVALRKPQCVFGWDQTPRVSTCGITGEAGIDLIGNITVRDLHVETLSIENGNAFLLADVEVDNAKPTYAEEANVLFTVEKDGCTVYSCEKDLLLQPGINPVDFSFTLDNPELWWPQGYGEQPLYTVHVRAVLPSGEKDEKTIRTGIRRVIVKQPRINEDERQYYFEVNGKEIYAKGADFILTDALYASIKKEKQIKILTAAKNGNFNMLRFWDGGRYEPDYVYDYCDEAGILVFQNFNFCVGAYPDHLEWFRNEVEKEVVYQLRRLRSHPCIALWCGNGESTGLLDNYLGRSFIKETDRAFYNGGLLLYNQMFPRLCRLYCSSVMYQCCSPFGGFEEQQTSKRGDFHYYPFLNIDPSMQQYRISFECYKNVDYKFITESGIMGPPSLEAFEKYCGNRECIGNYEDPVFLHHCNTFEKLAVRDAVYRHYTGEKKLSPEEYCLYGGLFQAAMISYAADQFRLGKNCGGTLLWCLNDAFGEVGFSFLDHDGDAKPVYNALRRCYSQNHLMIRKNDKSVCVYCTNDSDHEKTVSVRCGYVSYAGCYEEKAYFKSPIPAFSKKFLLGTFPSEGWDLKRGTLYAISEDEEILPAMLPGEEFRKLILPKKASLSVSDISFDGNCTSFTISSDVFAHGVHFGVSKVYLRSDEFFDLLPGESLTISIESGHKLTEEEIAPECVYLGE